MFFRNEHAPLASTVTCVSQFVILFGGPTVVALYWPDNFILPDGFEWIEGTFVGIVATVLFLMHNDGSDPGKNEYGSSNFDK